MAAGQIKIVVAGGNQSKSVEKYTCTSEKIAEGKWELLEEMSEYRAYASSVVYQGRMIVTGGQGIPFDVEERDLAQQKAQWKTSSLNLNFEFEQLNGHVCVRKDPNRFLVIGGRSTGEKIYEIQLKDSPPYPSKLVTEMPEPLRNLCNHCAVRIGDEIFIIGGTKGPDTRDTVALLNVKTNECTELGRLPYPVSHMAATLWLDNVLVLGGKNKENKALNTAIMYNVTLKKAIRFPPMKNKRYGCTAVTIGDNIIVMGGWNEAGEKLKSVECYNVVGGWKDLPDMNERRAAATAARCNITSP